mgnify:CR=1 FL=1
MENGRVERQIGVFLLINIVCFLAFAIINLTPFLVRWFPINGQITLLLIWIITSMMARPYYYFKSPLFIKILVWFVYLSLLQLLGFADLAIGNLFNYLTFWFCMVIMDFYNEVLDPKVTSTIMNVMFSTMVINILFNIKELLANPYLSKIVTAYGTIELGFQTNVGNYSFTLSSAIIMLSCLHYFSVRKESERPLGFFYLVIGLLSLYMIVLASSMIGIITAFIMIFVFLVAIGLLKGESHKTVMYLCFAISIILLVLLFRDSIYYLLRRLSLNMDNELIRVRFNEVLEFLFGDKEKASLSGREFLYRYSIKTFLENPIFGVGRGHTRIHGLIGLHSQILDDLAYYGLAGFTLIISILFNFKKRYMNYYKAYLANGKALIWAYGTGVLFFALFNPFANINIGLMIFVFFPLYCKDGLKL